MPKHKSTPSREDIEKLEKRIGELEHQWKRALADYQNLEKRTAGELTRNTQFATAELVKKLLLLRDDLERAASHTQDKGLKLILDQFKKIVEDEGVTEIKALGEPFDPTTMTAIDVKPGKKDQVFEVASPGYRLHERVLRPAKVYVGKGEQNL